jgi:hypothetical protein
VSSTSSSIPIPAVPRTPSNGVQQEEKQGHATIGKPPAKASEYDIELHFSEEEEDVESSKQVCPIWRLLSGTEEWKADDLGWAVA